MKVHIFIFIFAVSAILGSTVQANDDYLSYGIPANVKKVGPTSTRDPNIEEILYFSGSSQTRQNLIAVERLNHGTLVSRELFKQGSRHGVQREWHINGVLKSESPYRDGKMDGLFRVWDQNGALIGQYLMIEGNGIVKVYNSDGFLAREGEFKDNVRDGIRMERISGVISFTWYKKGVLFGCGFDVFSDGSLANIACFSDAGVPNGPVIEYSKAGAVVNTTWYINNIKVSEKEYAEAAAGSAGALPYYADPSMYKTLLTKDVSTVIQRYLTLPKVEIPLRFDAMGKAIPAS